MTDQTPGPVPGPALDLDEIEEYELAWIDGGEQGIAESDYQSRTILALVAEVKRLREALQASREIADAVNEQLPLVGARAIIRLADDALGRCVMARAELTVMLADLDEVKALVAGLASERDAARAALTRVEALCDEAGRDHREHLASGRARNLDPSRTRLYVHQVRAALAAAEPDCTCGGRASEIGGAEHRAGCGAEPGEQSKETP